MHFTLSYLVYASFPISTTLVISVTRNSEQQIIFDQCQSKIVTANMRGALRRQFESGFNCKKR